MIRPRRENRPATAAAIALLLCGASSAFASPETEFRSQSEATGRLPGEPPIVAPAPRPNELVGKSPGVRRLRQRGWYLGGAGQTTGALSGKTVYLSPGHGWTYSASANWYSQRGKTHGVVEDMSNADGIAQFLLPYLWAAGAQVMPVRELDQQKEMVILDDSDGQSAPARGSYSESGNAALFSDSTLKGWGQVTFPFTGAENPFTVGGNRLIETTTTETARATFVLNVPKSGYYHVYVSYSMYSARAPDARYIVVHPGGQTTYLVDQRRHGATWVLLGRHYFDAGSAANKGAIIVSNQSAQAGTWVSVDAVRIGGGLGLIDRGGGVSGQPRADENSRYNAQFCGAPASVYNASSGDDGTDDVGTRSRFTAWLHEDGEDAVYLSHHSNAFNGATRGTETYIYGTNAPNGSYAPTAAALALGSDKLAKAMHDELITDIRAAFDPNWKDRGVKSAYFGEINPSNNGETPSALIELAFHDEPQDAALLADPRFRRVAGRAIYKGIVKYFAAKDGSPVHLIPEPPVAVQARNSQSGEVTVSWQAPPSGGILGHPATSYRVYVSRHGFAFDEGTDTAGQRSLKLSGLKAGEVIFVRVVATNAGGESLPAPTLAVGVAATGRAPLLLVGGFDRLDGDLDLILDYPKFTQVSRLLLERMNDGTLLAHYGRALAGRGVAFDSAWHDAVGGSAGVALTSYSSVLWAAGKGVSADEALTPAAIEALLTAGKAGVGLLISGSTVARTLSDALAPASARELLEQQLLATLEGADQTRSEVLSEGTGVLAGAGKLTLVDMQGRPFPAGNVDLLAAATGGTLAASYDGSGGAVVQRKSESSCSVLASFPLAAIVDEDARANAIAQLAQFCPLAQPPASDAGPPPSDGGPGLDVAPPVGDGATTTPAEEGCGCRVGQRDLPSLGLFGLLLLLALRRRRSVRP